MIYTRAEDLRVGDFVHGRRVKEIRPYQVPAVVLHDYYAKRHPEGMPGFIVEYVGGGGITLFAGEEYPDA